MIGVVGGKGDRGIPVVELDDHQRSHRAAIGAQQRPGDQHGIPQRMDMGQVRGARRSAQLCRIRLVDAVNGKIGHRENTPTEPRSSEPPGPRKGALHQSFEMLTGVLPGVAALRRPCAGRRHAGGAPRLAGAGRGARAAVLPRLAARRARYRLEPAGGGAAAALDRRAGGAGAGLAGAGGRPDRARAAAAGWGDAGIDAGHGGGDGGRSTGWPGGAADAGDGARLRRDAGGLCRGALAVGQAWPPALGQPGGGDGAGRGAGAGGAGRACVGLSCGGCPACAGCSARRWWHWHWSSRAIAACCGPNPGRSPLPSSAAPSSAWAAPSAWPAGRARWPAGAGAGDQIGDRAVRRSR